LASPTCAPPIVTDRVAWSVGLSVGVSPSEPCINGGSDRDDVCVYDSGGPRETPVEYSGTLRANTVLCICAHLTQYNLLVYDAVALLWLRPKVNGIRLWLLPLRILCYWGVTWPSHAERQQAVYSVEDDRCVAMAYSGRSFVADYGQTCQWNVPACRYRKYSYPGRPRVSVHG